MHSRREFLGRLSGASAGIFGLLVAAALIAPSVQVFYYMFPVTIGMLAIFGMLTALYSVVSVGYNAGGEAAHLGGGILGFAIMKNQHWLNAFTPARKRVASTPNPRARKRRRPFLPWQPASRTRRRTFAWPRPKA